MSSPLTQSPFTCVCYESIKGELNKDSQFVYYESIKRELNQRLIYVVVYYESLKRELKSKTYIFKTNISVFHSLQVFFF